MPYADYLTTPEWRRTRDRALRLARHRCRRCDCKHELQVHHLTSANVGEELDSDLEVLCRGCHLGHHVVEAQEQVRLYARIVSALVQTRQFDSVSELVEAAKRECVRLKITYNAGQIQAAIAAVLPQFRGRVPKATAQRLETAPEGQGATRAEAAGILSRIVRTLGQQAGIKHMPEARIVTQTDYLKAKAALQVAQLISESMAKCDALEREPEELNG